MTATSVMGRIPSNGRAPMGFGPKERMYSLFRLDHKGSRKVYVRVGHAALPLVIAKRLGAWKLMLTCDGYSLRPVPPVSSIRPVTPAKRSVKRG